MTNHFPVERTEMKCVRCGGFSSTRVCWHCSRLPDAIPFAEVERLLARIEQLERELAEARTANATEYCRGRDDQMKAAKEQLEAIRRNRMERGLS